MLSMTGYGRGEYKSGGIELTVEIKTVNNRYLDISIKAPRIFIAYEEAMCAAVSNKVKRGHVEIFVSYCDNREKQSPFRLNENAALAYIRAAERVVQLSKKGAPSMKFDYDATSILRLPEVMVREEMQCADEELISALDSALLSALENLNAKRLKEGAKTKSNMLAYMDTLELIIGNLSKRRSNIDEELTRLRSYIKQFKELCDTPVVGKRLNFLIEQKFIKEVDIICSKDNDTIGGLVADLQEVIEVIGTQAQNVE